MTEYGFNLTKGRGPMEAREEDTYGAQDQANKYGRPVGEQKRSAEQQADDDAQAGKDAMGGFPDEDPEEYFNHGEAAGDEAAPESLLQTGEEWRGVITPGVIEPEEETLRREKQIL